MPSFSPQNVTLVNKTSTSIFIKWDATPDNLQKSDNILGYKVNYTLKKKAFGRRATHVINVTMVYANLTELKKFRFYRIAVLAFNQHGDGPPSDILDVRTEEDSKL